MTRSAHVVGWGKYLPTEVLDNKYFEKLVDTSDEWIQARTGILERRRAHPKEHTSSLAIKAAWSALEVADIAPRQIDAIIVATLTPDYAFPGTACLVQDALGCSHAAAFDLNAGCTGFVYALSVGTDLIRSGSYNTILVIGAETLTRITDYADRATCVLFGDGAGAVVLQGSDQPGGVLASVLGADGSGGGLLQLPAGGSRHPSDQETVDSRMHFIKMNGNEVYKFAVGAMGRAARAAASKAGLTLDDVSLFIPHQANYRIIQSATKNLGVKPEKVYSNLHRYGNTSAASVPVALCEALEEGRIQPGDNIILVAFGAGLTWGAAAVKWGEMTHVAEKPWWQIAVRTLRDRRAAVQSAAKKAGRKIDMWWPHRNGVNGNGN